MELFCHVPMSWVCFYLYVKQKRSRRVVEAFVGGLQFAGTICYYLPEALRGMEHWYIFIYISSSIFVLSCFHIIPHEFTRMLKHTCDVIYNKIRTSLISLYT